MNSVFPGDFSVLYFLYCPFSSFFVLFPRSKKDEKDEKDVEDEKGQGVFLLPLPPGVPVTWGRGPGLWAEKKSLKKLRGKCSRRYSAFV